MHRVIYVLSVGFAVVFAAEKGSPCVTPNGEKATCISINSCPVIQRAIRYLEEPALDFARKSQCGYDDAPLVCCGTEGEITDPHRTTTPLPRLYQAPPSLVAEHIRHILLPDSSLCGHQSKPNSRSGATVTESHEYPWLVALKYEKEGGGPGGFRCSGTLINHRYVLTAAHCINIAGYNLIEVHMGEWNLDSKGHEHDYFLDEVKNQTVLRRQIYPVVETAAHPYYTVEEGSNNIALLRIEQKATYTPYVRPICLPPRDFHPPPAGYTIETTGWSTTKDGTLGGIKLKANYSAVANPQCNATFTNYSFVHPNEACVKTAADAELYESGRPILRNYLPENTAGDDRQWFQEGILYKQAASEKKGATVLYTRLSRYITWILNNIRKS